MDEIQTAEKFVLFVPQTSELRLPCQFLYNIKVIAFPLWNTFEPNDHNLPCQYTLLPHYPLHLNELFPVPCPLSLLNKDECHLSNFFDLLLLKPIRTFPIQIDIAALIHFSLNTLLPLGLLKIDI